MGILNVTPDSFYTESRISSQDDILNKAKKMIADGASILDVGGYSSRPGAHDISIQEELDRVIPAIELLTAEINDCIISIDSFRSEVAKEAIKAGACMVNDISGGQADELMFEVVAEHAVPYVLMHMKGNPQNMQTKTEYDNLIKDINYFFSVQIRKAIDAGVKDIILDPGFGFSKTTAQNFELLKNLEMMHLLEKPLLIGISRKSMIYKKLGIGAEESLNGTTVLNTMALCKGAQILRVHDVKEAKESIDLLKATHCEELH